MKSSSPQSQAREQVSSTLLVLLSLRLIILSIHHPICPHVLHPTSHNIPYHERANRTFPILDDTLNESMLRATPTSNIPNWQTRSQFQTFRYCRYTACH